MKLNRYLILISFLCINLFANKLVIDAAKFELNEKEGISIFSGNVKMKKVNDRIDAQKIEVYTSKPDEDGKREMKKFIATGSVYFTVYAENKIYQGKGDKVEYNPEEMKYIITGNGFVEEKVEGTKLFGELIYLDEKSGEAEIKGDKKKPVRFIMDLKE